MKHQHIPDPSDLNTPKAGKTPGQILDEAECHCKGVSPMPYSKLPEAVRATREHCAKAVLDAHGVAEVTRDDVIDAVLGECTHMEAVPEDVWDKITGRLNAILRRSTTPPVHADDGEWEKLPPHKGHKFERGDKIRTNDDHSKWQEVENSIGQEHDDSAFELLRKRPSPQPGNEPAGVEKCKTCNGLGIVGGVVGQTPEQYDKRVEPCPDCASPAAGEEGKGETATPRTDALYDRGSIASDARSAAHVMALDLCSELETELATAQAQLAAMTKRAEKAESRIVDADKEIESFSRQCQELLEKEDASNHEKGILRTELDAMKQRAEKSEFDLKESNELLFASPTKCASLVTQLAERDKEVERLNRESEMLQEIYTQAEKLGWNFGKIPFSQWLTQLRSRGGRLTAEQIEEAYNTTPDEDGWKLMAGKLNASLQSPWIAITSDPESRPKEGDADRNGNVEWLRNDDEIFVRKWSIKLGPAELSSYTDWRTTDLPSLPTIETRDEDAFEKWAKTMRYDLSKDARGEYTHNNTAHSFKAWEAALSNGGLNK